MGIAGHTRYDWWTEAINRKEKTGVMTRDDENRLSTGIKGLDTILMGGLIPRRSYLVRGKAGTGKTTLGLHFLGQAPGKNLFISFSENPKQIAENAEKIGIDVEDISFLDLSPNSEFFSEVQVYDIFSPGEVEREPITKEIIATTDRIQPERVFIDAITQLRYLATETIEFRRYAMSLIQYMKERDITLLFTSEESENNPDDELRFICDGIIHLRYTRSKRVVQIEKFRGSDYRHGEHTIRLSGDGVSVYPRLREPEKSELVFSLDSISSGIERIDKLLYGGLERGTVTLFSGPTGVGKTTLGIQFMHEAAVREERSVVFTFEEDDRTILERTNALNIPILDMLESDVLTIHQIEPLRYTQDEFAHMVREEVEENNAQIVMIDSISGYELSLQGDNLIRHLHTLCKYLRNQGVTVILVNEVHRIVDPFRATEIDISYLMDSIVFMRYFENDGELRRAVGVLKKRVSDFEKSMREIMFTSDGIIVGEPLEGLFGILTGTKYGERRSNTSSSSNVEDA